MLHYKQEDISQNLQRYNDVRWRPGQEVSLALHVRTWGLEANVLYWRKYLWCDIVETFRRPPAVIGAPMV